ncbi:MAG: ATP-grasp domain-containing protein [Gammaproteobacteria bacterium]|nr:ATP-grasp domain-containing protein [Gammaproteobacteria bacterium]MBU1654103.1 ATP-grasp domain-containing protein [Gammaproteobacteria bacterium]MBU1961680.1 ATP-grasp domain-containing protein [Gammaproteobacteria bacterium]
MDGLFDRVYRMPKPELNPGGYLRRLGSIFTETNAGFLIPTLDPEVTFFSHHYSGCQEAGIRCVVPSPEVLHRVAKSHLVAIGRESGFRVPRLYAVTTQKEAITAAQEIGLPLMIKGAFYEAHRIEYLDEIPHFFRKLTHRWGLPVLLQAIVTGVEAVVACLCDQPGRLARAVGMRKFGMSEQGTTWCGVTFYNEPLFDACRDLMDRLKWIGPCEVEVKIDEQSGMLTLLEVNTRFPSWIGIVPELGSNLPDDFIRVMEGRDIGPDPGFKTGVLMVRQHNDRAIPLARFIDLASGEMSGG